MTTTPATTTRLQPSDPGYRGQADYTPGFLALYDKLVLGVFNRLVWGCPTAEILGLYEEQVAGEHLDAGPGTGWYLDHCMFAEPPRTITLLDANPDVLEFAARRLARFEPRVHQANLLRPIDLEPESFDSIALTHVLHCLPGTITQKSAVLGNLSLLLRPGGCIFGSTILNGGVPHTAASRALLRFLNQRGVFGNFDDDREALEHALGSRFAEHEIRVCGSVALFVARV
jgi:SAM-dependent methyltransferase